MKPKQKKSKKSTAKRLLEFTGRWAGEPPAEEAANYGNTGPVKKKRSWSFWGIITDGRLGFCLHHERESALDLVKTWKSQNELLGCSEKFEVKKVKVTEV